jgi:hypothetical protein
MTVKEVNHIRCFATDITKDLILLSSQVGKRIKDKKERVFGSTSYEHYIRRPKSFVF